MLGDVVFLTISIHAPREGCDWRQPVAFSVRSDFNPRTPRGVRRSGLTRWAISQVFQSTHPARGATVLALLREGRPVLISIHAPREGCDFMEVNRILMGLNISIHAPREGCDVTQGGYALREGISIHAPREGCDHRLPRPQRPPPWYFNPRTPRGVRHLSHQRRLLQVNFNPRTPRGVRLWSREGGGKIVVISIHAPREGCDGCFNQIQPMSGIYFNPRTPRGVRQANLVRL